MAATAWDAARIVAVATVVVAVANLIFLWFNAQAMRRHEVAMQRTARTQARIEETYRQFVEMMERTRDWANHNVSPGPVPPAPIEDREVSEARARLRTFGSEGVVEAADRWGDALSSVTDTIAQDDLDAAVILLSDLKDREEAVRRLMRDELTGS